MPTVSTDSGFRAEPVNIGTGKGVNVAVGVSVVPATGSLEPPLPHAESAAMLTTPQSAPRRVNPDFNTRLPPASGEMKDVRYLPKPYQSNPILFDRAVRLRVFSSNVMELGLH